MQTAPILDEELFLILDLEPDEPIMCESYHHNVEQGLPPHPAHWYASCVCGSPVLAICEGRRHLAYISDGWRCTPQGCGKYHPYDDINFSPINRR